MIYQNDVINVAVVNFKSASGNKAVNLAKMEEFAESAAKRGADLIVFPEMCLMGYDYFINKNILLTEKIKNTETVKGNAVTLMAEISKKYGVYIVFGMSEKEEESSEILYNSAICLGPDGFIGAYRKIHPYGSENTWCVKGDEPFMIDTKWGPIGVGICYDSYKFPELARYYAYKGARLYLNPTAVSRDPNKEGGTEAFVRSYAPKLEYLTLSTDLFVASANLTGYDDTNYFAGRSVILGPKLVACGDIDVVCYGGDYTDEQAGVIMTTIDLSLSQRNIFVENPYTGTADFRPEIYKKFYE